MLTVQDPSRADNLRYNELEATTMYPMGVRGKDLIHAESRAS
jgi:hypothetical protein